MKKIVFTKLIMAIILSIPMFSIGQISFTPPTVLTLPVSGIHGDSVTLKGYVKKNTGGNMILLKGFAFKQVSDSNYSYVTVNDIDTFTYELTGLQYNTQYSYRTIAITPDSLFEGNELFFTTDNPMISPSVATASASDITQSSANLNGTLVKLGNPPPTEMGFIFGFTPNITIDSTKYLLSIDSARSYSYSVPSLLNSTTYYYRMYIKNLNITVLGSVLSFTTPAPNVTLPTLMTYNAQNVDTSSAKLIGKITNPGVNITILSKGFEYKNVNNTSYLDIPITSVGDSMVYSLSGLTPSTTYTYKAYVETSTNGRVYGPTKSFTTQTKPYEFTTLAATSVTDSSAIINGRIFKSELIIQKFGFYFKEDGNNYGLFDLTQNFTLNGPTNINYQMKKLKPYTNYTYKVFGLTFNGLYEGAEISFRTNSLPMSISTQAITNLGETSAKLNARLNKAGAPKTIEKGFLVSSNPSFNISSIGIDKHIIPGDTAGVFSYNISNLTSNTTYYTRAYTINQLDTVYGSILSFKTLMPLEVIPDITLIAPDSISFNSAILKANISTGANPALIEMGFEYKTVNESDYTVITFPGSIASLSIANKIENLLPNTLYQFKAYAKNMNNTLIYSDEMEFTTLIKPMVVLTNQATDISFDSAVMNGFVNPESEIVFFKGFEWRADSDSVYERVFVFGDSIFSYTLNNLSPNTTYWYRFFAKSSEDYVYGDSVSFTTLTVNPPQINNIIVEGIDTNSARFIGQIQEGTNDIINRSLIIKRWGREFFTPIEFEGNSFDITIDTLEEGTTYYAGIYILTSEGAKISDIIEFRTLGTFNIGLEDITLSDNNISIYPNPAKDFVNISINNSQGVELRILDILGREIDKRKLNSDINYDISKLEKGVYNLIFINKSSKLSKKLIVK